MRGVVLANEVLDAMPVERFVLRGRPGGIDVRALGVGLTDDGFEWRETSPERRSSCTRWPISSRRCRRRCPTATCRRCAWRSSRGWRASRRSWRRAWRCSSTTACRARTCITRIASTGTLRCHFRHRAHDDPFINVGLQDITAWVDFTRVAEAADSAGLEVLGFASQAAFLIGAGMESLLTTEMQLAAEDTRQQARLAGEARRLCCPGRWARSSRSSRSGADTSRRSPGSAPRRWPCSGLRGP